jgi:hypothetical protein
MKKKVLVATLAAACWAGSPTAGQETQNDSLGILQAIALPTIAGMLRDRGVPVEELETAIFGARGKGVPAGETAGVLEATALAVEANGPIENFGAFVQARLDAGLRGRELAQAIRAEHARRGIGKGSRLESRGPGQEGQGRPGAAGRGQDGARPDAAGRQGQGGPEVRDTSRGPDPEGPHAADSAGRRGPPAALDQGSRRRATVPDSTPQGGGNGGDA